MSASVGIRPDRRSAGVMKERTREGRYARQPCPLRRSPLSGRLPGKMRSGGRVVEGARLESEYTAKPYRGFESLPLRHSSYGCCPGPAQLSSNSPNLELVPLTDGG